MRGKRERIYAYVRSSYGDIRIDHDGAILDIRWDEEEDRYLEDIARFDLDEFYRYYGHLDQEYDILDLGYWDKKGKYFPPEPSYRKQPEQ